MRIATVAVGVLAVAWSTGCGPGLPPNTVATHLQVTTNTTERYHVLAERPFDTLLGHDGYVVALEKVDRDIAHPRGAAPRCAQRTSDGSPPARSSERVADHPYWCLIDDYPGKIERENRPLWKHLHDRLDDRKLMVVTHVLAYEGGGPGVRFLYNVYDALRPQEGRAPWSAVVGDDGRPVLDHDKPLYDRPTDAEVRGPAAVPLVAPPGSSGESYYWRGIQALTETLAGDVRARMGAAAGAGRPYTHLVVGAMGWDNDQVESVRRYAATLGNVHEAARRDGSGAPPFRPLFIGLTWPSVWGWASWFDFGQLAYKLVGYGNKADDADEVGYTVFNYLLQGLARQTAPALCPGQAPGDCKALVTFGHSFGARVVSRALFSDERLRPELRAGPRAPVALFVGLQGAFSVNRFVKECGSGGDGFCGNEGGPYVGFRELRTPIVLTTSRHDTANPLSWFITGAMHSGGWLGHRQASRHPVRADGTGVFLLVDYTNPAERFENDAACARYRDARAVLMVDVSSFVFGHSDVLDLEAGELLWSTLRCFAPNPP